MSPITAAAMTFSENDPSDPEGDTSDEENLLENILEDEELEIIELNDDPPAEGDNDDEDEDQNENAATEEDVEVVDNAESVLIGHKGPVFSCAVSPDGKTLVTGGQDDIAIVWDLEKKDVLFTCTEHVDSVTCVAFSYKGKYVATGDMAGTIKVWHVKNKELVATYDMDDLLWMKWHPKTNALLAGTEYGNAYMWEVPSGRCRVYAGNNSRNECGIIMPDGENLAFGFENGNVTIWHVKGTQVLHNIPYPTPANASGVTSMDCSDKAIAVGYKNGTTIMYNTNNGNVLGQLNCFTRARGTEDCSVEAVAFHHFNNRLNLITATAKGEITVWDSGTMSKRYGFVQEAGLTRLLWHPQRQLICTSGTDGCIRVIDAQLSEVIRTLTGHTDEIHDMVITSDGTKLLTTSEDCTCREFDARFDA